jgi:hypothetical protein
MSDYDKAMMDCFNRVYAAAIGKGMQTPDASRVATAAVNHFKSQFHRPDFRKGNY